MNLKTTQHIGRYEIRGEIGRGAMGVVYKAHDPKIDRMVALKTILLFNLDPQDEQEYRQRFVQEVRAAGHLSHPGIVTIFDAESSPENANPFIVMEYVDGKSLNKLLSENKSGLPIAAALRLAQEIAEALQFAHSKGVIHRDIKPENILVTPDGHAKIADFGIARMDQGHLTLPGRALGSPAYMSPEQLEGENTDARSDIFSLGVVLYTMLAGHRPFQGNSTATICFKLANRDPMPISAWNLDCPRELDVLVGRAMAKDPAQRFQTAAEMARAVQSFLENHASEPKHLESILRIIGQESVGTPQNAGAEAGIATEIAGESAAPGPQSDLSRELVPSTPTPPQTALLPIASVAQKPAHAKVAIAPVRRSLSLSSSFSSSLSSLSSAARGGSWAKKAGAMAAALLVIGGFALWSKQKHSPEKQLASSAPLRTVPVPAAEIAVSPATRVASSTETEMEKLKREEVESSRPVTAPADTVVRMVQPSLPRPLPMAPREPAQPMDLSIAGSGTSSSGDVTVRMIHLSDLTVTIEHSFEEAQASISVDNRTVFNRDLRGEKKRRALVFSRTQGTQSDTITLLPGTHDIVVRVQSPANNYDATEKLTQSFSPGSRRTLLVKCDRRKNRLALLLR